MNDRTEWFLVCAGFTAMGCVMAVAGASIWAPIFRYKALSSDKAWLILAALSLADSLAGIGHAAQGFVFMINGPLDYNVTYTRWECLVKSPYIWLETLFMIPQGVLLLALSADRLCLAVCPCFYVSALHVHHIRIMLYVVFAIPWLKFVVVIYEVYTDAELRSRYNLCTTLDGMPDWSFAFDVCTTWVGAVGSVVLQAITVYVFRWRHAKVATRSSTGKISQSASSTNQRAFTRRVNQSVLATVILVVIPVLFMIVFHLYLAPKFEISKNRTERIGMLINTIPYLNPLLNSILFLRRNPLLKYALRALVKNKELPDNQSMWNIE